MFRILGTPIFRSFCSQAYKVRVANLSYQVTEDQVQDRFSQIGQVKEVKLVRYISGNSKGNFCRFIYGRVRVRDVRERGVL